MYWQYATSIGRAAYEILSREGEGSLLGNTSRGMFILGPKGAVFFLSFEKHRGPVSITLPSRCERLRELPAGSSVIFRDQRIIFPSIGVGVWLQKDRVWNAGPPGPAGPPEERLGRLRSLIETVISSEKDGGLSGMLPLLAGMNMEEGSTEGELPVLAERVREVAHTWRRGDVQNVGRRLRSILGLGRGLTPSGDDFCLGMILILRRWPTIHGLGPAVDEMIQGLEQAARKKTTAISASLIGWAARGQADERILLAADHLVTGEPAILGSSPGLLSWGASSGVDALAGMALVLSTYPDKA